MSKNLSIAYAMSKGPKKMADGGPVIDPNKAKDFIKGFTSVREHDECPSCGYAKGGEVGKSARNKDKSFPHERQKGVHPSITSADPGTSNAGAYHGKYGSNQETSKRIHSEKLDELKSMPAPKLKGLAGGGLVDRIMAKRMSEGGVASNEPEESADEMPNEFDDLVLDDNLEADYVGSEELGDEQESDDRSDIVSKILASRRKKDRNPRPA